MNWEFCISFSCGSVNKHLLYHQFFFFFQNPYPCSWLCSSYECTVVYLTSPMLLEVFDILQPLWWKTEKAMAPHSSTLAWKIPWMEEPGRLQSMGSRRVGHDWATSLSLFTFTRCRRKWQPTPVFLPGESQGWGSLLGCRLWGRTESDTTEVTSLHLWWIIL